jgi:hypothetical protein
VVLLGGSHHPRSEALAPARNGETSDCVYESNEPLFRLPPSVDRIASKRVTYSSRRFSGSTKN